MASENRNKNPDVDLLEALHKEPYSFGFFEALRQLECYYKDKPRLGESVRPVDDAIRLGQIPSTKFAPSTLASFDNKGTKASSLQVFFFGLFGPNGPLPLHLTEYTRYRLRHAKDPVMADFMDLFHHRLLSLFYRAWANKEPTVHHDRPETDRFADYIGSLFGLGVPSARSRDAMPDNTKLHFAGHLGCHNRHAEGLSSILSSFFQIPIKVEEFIGEWLDIPTNSYCYLDNNGETAQLGQSAIIGTRSWQCQSKFRIRLGPINLKDYERMLPVGDRIDRIIAIVRNYIGHEFNWDLNLVLKKEEVPPVKLGQYGRLGWTTWLQKKERRSDASDLHLKMGARLANR